MYVYGAQMLNQDTKKKKKMKEENKRRRKRFVSHAHLSCSIPSGKDFQFYGEQFNLFGIQFFEFVWI